MARGRQRARFSLFAFQDIVTGLCGVLILLVLTMVVDLADQRELEGAHSVSDVANEEKTAALRKEIAELEKKLESAREAARNAIISIKDTVAPEDAARLTKEMTEKERKLAALVTQVEDLRTRVEAAKETDARNRKKVREMEESRRALENRLAALKNRKGVTLIPERGSIKSPVYIVCGRGGVEVLYPLVKKVARKWIAFDEIKDGLTDELVKLDHTIHTVVLLVRPSGVEKMNELANLVKSLGFSCGRDPLEEDVDVSLGETGGDT